MSVLATAARVVGRAAVGVPFMILGYEAAKDPGPRTQLAEGLGVPEPELMVRVNGAAMVAGGLGLATGVLSRPAAAGIALSLIPTTLAGHAYWDVDDPADRGGQRVHFLKNLGLAGALLALAASPRPRG